MAINTLSTDNICYLSYQGQRYPINVSVFYRAPKEVKDYWLDDESYLLAYNALVVWFEYEGQFYAAQEIDTLRLEFLALTGQIAPEKEPF